MKTLSDRRRACSSSSVLTSTNALEPCALIAADTAPPAKASSSASRPGKVREVVREGVEVGVGQLSKLHGHGAGIADAGAGLVLAHRLEQIVLALIRQARHLLAPGEVGFHLDPLRDGAAGRCRGAAG